MRDSDNPSTTPVSTVFDVHGNRIDRYETRPTDGQPVIRVTLAPRWDHGTAEDRERAKAAVEAWYWRHVGTAQQPPETLPDASHAVGDSPEQWTPIPESEPSPYAR
jgi:hypothetical protein